MSVYSPCHPSDLEDPTKHTQKGLLTSQHVNRKKTTIMIRASYLSSLWHTDKIQYMRTTVNPGWLVMSANKQTQQRLWTYREKAKSND